VGDIDDQLLDCPSAPDVPISPIPIPEVSPAAEASPADGGSPANNLSPDQIQAKEDTCNAIGHYAEVVAADRCRVIDGD